MIIGTGERDRDWHFCVTMSLLRGLRFGFGIRIDGIEIGILPVGFEVCDVIAPVHVVAAVTGGVATFILQC
jgi:hypothetical protein